MAADRRRRVPPPPGLKTVRVDGRNGYWAALRYESSHPDEAVVGTNPSGDGGLILTVAPRRRSR